MNPSPSRSSVSADGSRLEWPGLLLFGPGHFLPRPFPTHRILLDFRPLQRAERMLKRKLLTAILMGGLLLTGSAAQAENVALAAHLLGGNNVPANKSDAFAEGQFTYDTAGRTLDYYVTYDGI